MHEAIAEHLHEDDDEELFAHVDVHRLDVVGEDACGYPHAHEVSEGGEEYVDDEDDVLGEIYGGT